MSAAPTMRVCASAITVIFSFVYCSSGPPDGVQVHDLLTEFPAAELHFEVSSLNLYDPAAREHLDGGWSVAESSEEGSWVWNAGRASTLRFHLAQARDLEVEFRCLPFVYPGAPPQTVTVLVNGHELAAILLAKEMRAYRVQVPGSTLRTGINKLRFQYAQSRAAIAVKPGAHGVRPLSVVWHSLTIHYPDGPRGSAKPIVEGAELIIPYGSQVDYYLSLPAASRLRFEELSLPGGGSLEVEVAPGGGAPSTLQGFQSSGGAQEWVLPVESAPIALLSLRAVPPPGMPPAEEAAEISSPAVWAGRPPTAPGGGPPEPSAPGRRRPNILIYLIDALRADHLGVYGYPRPVSPHIDGFAQDSAVFRTAVAQAPFTKTAITSILTGLGPRTHRVMQVKHTLPEAVVTLAEYLSALGYSSDALMTNQVLREAGLDQGFDSFSFLRDSEMPERFGKWLTNRDPSSPFFLYLHTSEPHESYEPPAQHRRRFASNPAPEPTAEQTKVLRTIAAKRYDRWDERHLAPGSRVWMDALLVEEFDRPEDHVPAMIDLYDGEIATADETFGMVMKALKENGLYEPTLIVFLADHGEEFYDHRSWLHGKSFYSEVLHVPLMVKLPGGETHPGLRKLPVAQQIDIAPTILEYLGAGVPGQLEGASLLGPVRSPDHQPADRIVFSYLGGGLGRGGSAIDYPWKFIWDPATQRADQLYNLETDPTEQHDLSEKHPIQKGYLKAALKRHLLQEPNSPRPGTADMDEELLKSLRNMGYLQ